MAFFSIDDLVGNGALKDLLPRLLDEGWDDVPTLKIMKAEDMDAMNMTQQQKDTMEIRKYLHDRALMQYADKFEVSGKCLSELLSLSTGILYFHFGMKRGHIARFRDKANPCADPSDKSYVREVGKMTIIPPRTHSSAKSSGSISPRRFHSTSKLSTRSSMTPKKPLSNINLEEDYKYKGIVAAGPAEPRVCGFVQPPQVIDRVAPYSSIRNISLQKLTPEHKIGMQRWVTIKNSTVKASDLWQEKPAVLLCIRRPGCIMCRAESHKLYTKKPIFDALGVQLYVVLHEEIESQVIDFWPHYWGGIILLDRSKEFFKALGGRELLKDKFMSGFLFNPRAIANYKFAKAMGMKQNFKGEGRIKGGLFIVGKGKNGIAYQFIERNFGDWAPVAEVIENQQEGQGESTKTSQEYE